jgi:TolA-binding protein
VNALVFAALVALLPGAPLGLLENPVRLKEAELRLMLVERNLDEARHQTAAKLAAGRRADELRLHQRYARLAEPWLASERRSRAAALGRLSGFAAQYDDPVYTPDALLRIAVLELEEADEGYVERMRAYEAVLDAGGAAPQPQKDYRAALRTLRAMLARYPGAEHRDVAAYLTGYAYLEMGEADLAQRAFLAILAAAPPGELRTELLVRVGDYYFERNATGRAEPFYREAAGGGDAWVDRALYKWAWALYKLDRYADAVSAFSRVLDLGSARSDLQSEALQYLAVSYVEGFGYANAVAHMAARGARPFDTALITRIADVLYDSTEYASAVSAYTLALRRSAGGAEELRLAQRIVNAYQQDRRLEEAVAARLQLYARFAPGAGWYERQDPGVRKAADDWSERNLYEYATFHHYRELRDHPESRPLAEAAYRTYLARYAGRPRAVQMGFYLAEMLYDRDAYPEALSYYTRVALSAPDPATDIASRAAYNMVLAGREMFRHDSAALDTLLLVSKRFAELRPGDERTPLVLYHAARLLCATARGAACRDEMSRLLELYPQSELAADAVRAVVDSFARENRYGELAAWADRLLERGRVVDAATRRFVLAMVGGAMFQDALSQERSGNTGSAAARYLAVYERYPDTPAGQTALYNAAFARERERRFLEALDLYGQLLARHPQAAFAARAAFRRGQIYEKAADYAAAVSAYSLVAERYPRAAEAKESLFNVGVLLALRGEHARAAEIFARHYATDGLASTAPEDTLLRAAAQWQEAGERARAQALFVTYVRLPVPTPQSAYAALRAAQLSTGTVRRQLLEAGLRLAAAVSGADPGVTAALRFESAEDRRAGYLAAGLPPELEKAAQALNRKAKLLKSLQAAYTAVVEAGDPEYAVAALYRIGEAYTAFADLLYAAPVPGRLSAEEADVYRAELEGQAAPLEEKAVEAYRKAAERAQKNGRETEWTALVRRALDDKPSSVRVLTDRLEPLYAPARHAYLPAAALALRDEPGRAEPPAPAAAAGTARVAAGRLDLLLRASLGEPRTYFKAGVPYRDTGAAGEN